MVLKSWFKLPPKEGCGATFDPPCVFHKGIFHTCLNLFFFAPPGSLPPTVEGVAEVSLLLLLLLLADPGFRLGSEELLWAEAKLL